MKTELKNLKFFRGREGQGFNADLWINGVKCIFIIDEGNGGCFNYQPYIYNNPKADIVKANIELLEAHIKTLPKVKGRLTVNDTENFDYELAMDMDTFIDELINQKEKEKHEKKKLKLMETSILFGVPNGNSFNYYQFRKPLSSYPKMQLQAKLFEIKSKHCKTGVEILNTNIEALGLKI